MKNLFIIYIVLALVKITNAQESDITLYYQFLNQRVQNYYALYLSVNASPVNISKNLTSFNNLLNEFSLNSDQPSDPTFFQTLSKLDTAYINSQFALNNHFIWKADSLANKKITLFNPQKKHYHPINLRFMFRKKSTSEFPNILIVSVPVFLTKDKSVAIVYEYFSGGGPDIFISEDLYLFSIVKGKWKRVAHKFISSMMS